ncbi:MAG: DUF2306 domain-containing protein [Alphaproteobacteria bacterium]|nr:DUF2306 domain-containing protein [Alphaproteobacteria bacterium]
MTAARVGGSVGWATIALLSVGVGGYAIFLTVTGFQYLGLKNNFPSPLVFHTHIAASGVAMVLGPFQFLKALRTGQPAIHRWMGRVYVAACVVGGLAGGSIALFSTSGLPAGLGFLLLAVLWVPFTLLAWTSAMNRNFIVHERWMIRSFALTFAAVTLRIYLPAAVIANHGAFPVPAYQVIAWICWVPNLIVAEIWIRSRPGLRLRRKVAAAPA